ncbi:energy transducer TonB [Qipengyuania flava]|uniref:energy transducer TonB n=1 Tax=Qipengyuania flava TaxID=192812 RepID=UPI001C634AC0|nr:energy transducer TonB [Qipengyuania flava]QYJ08194.1 energy transducer TonB [Qipengyuania flava]
MFSVIAAALVAASQPVAAPAAEEAPQPVSRPEGAEKPAELTRELRAKITPPTFVSGDRAPYPEEAKALGHHGEARVSVTIDETGSVTAAEIRKSTKSELLDASALATARSARFTPALDADGEPMPLSFVVPYEFYKSKSSEPGGGLVRYSCADFTLDTDWWESLEQVDDRGRPEKTQLENMLLGLRTIVAGRGELIPTDPKRFLQMMEDHRKGWAKAREKCRANPDKLLIDYLDNRKAIERLSEMTARERR